MTHFGRRTLSLWLAPSVLLAALLAPSPAEADYYLYSPSDPAHRTYAGSEYFDEDGTTLLADRVSDSTWEEEYGVEGFGWDYRYYIRVLNRSGQNIKVRSFGYLNNGRDEGQLATTSDNYVGMVDVADGGEQIEVFSALHITEVGWSNGNYAQTLYAEALIETGNFKLAVDIECDNGADGWVKMGSWQYGIPNPHPYWNVVVPPEACGDGKVAWNGSFHQGILEQEAAIEEAVAQSEAAERYKLNVANLSGAALTVASASLREATEVVEHSLGRPHVAVAAGSQSDRLVGYEGGRELWSDDLRVEGTGLFRDEVILSVEYRCADGSLHQVESGVLLDSNLNSLGRATRENYFTLWVADCEAESLFWTQEHQDRYVWAAHGADYAVTPWLNRDGDDGKANKEVIDRHIDDGSAPSFLSEEIYGTGALAGIECQANGVDASETGEVLAAYDLDQGCVCKHADQKDNDCEDYEIKLYYGWGNWFSATNQNGRELWLWTLRQQGRIGCTSPTRAQIRRGDEIYEVAKDAGDTTFDNVTGAKRLRFFVNNTYALRCEPSPGGNCDEFEFRYYCAE